MEGYCLDALIAHGSVLDSKPYAVLLDKTALYGAVQLVARRSDHMTMYAAKFRATQYITNAGFRVLFNLNDLWNVCASGTMTKPTSHRLLSLDRNAAAALQRKACGNPIN